MLGQLHVQHPVSRPSTQQQQQQQRQPPPDADPQAAAALQPAQHPQQDGQPQRPVWQLRRVDTLPALMQVATPQPRDGDAAADESQQEGAPQQQQQQQAGPAGSEQQADEYRGPKLRYGMQVSSRAELEAAVLAHWSATAGDRVPSTDKQESLVLPGLAGARSGQVVGQCWSGSRRSCELGCYLEHMR